MNYYVDRHAIFKFVPRRDPRIKKMTVKEADALVQWKAVLNDLNIGVIYALSPQAKGKIERPYRWLQDHLVRRCSRDKITRIDQAREILCEEVHRYNYKRVHSTTNEIPMVRYENALKNNQSVLKPISIHEPFNSTEDIFCYRFKRKVNIYQKIKFNKLQIAVSGVPKGTDVMVRVSFNPKTDMALVRLWYQGRIVGQQLVKAEDLKGVQF